MCDRSFCVWVPHVFILMRIQKKKEKTQNKNENNSRSDRACANDASQKENRKRPREMKQCTENKSSSAKTHFSTLTHIVHFLSCFDLDRTELYRNAEKSWKNEIYLYKITSIFFIFKEKDFFGMSNEHLCTNRLEIISFKGWERTQYTDVFTFKCVRVFVGVRT